MRLINTKTYKLHEFHGYALRDRQYAILSHRWEGREATFDEYRNLNVLKKFSATDIARSLEKIRSFCNLAASKDIEWAWVDTCCIDKSSSAELSESINSMFNWYRLSKLCIVYMSDVSYKDGEFHDSFKESAWFTRGWTLQELIAPRRLMYFDCSWQYLGTKQTLCKEASEVTRIPYPILYDVTSYQIEWKSVAARMSWAAKRQVSREEDVAYCLLGLFNVNMPLLYGEGATKAFRRLQHQIVEQIDDDSIFAWTNQDRINERYSHYSLLAESPSDFLLCNDLEYVPEMAYSTRPYNLTGKGLHIQLPLFRPHFSENDLENMEDLPFRSRWVAPLNCKRHDKRFPIALYLTQISSNPDKYVRTASGQMSKQLTDGSPSDIFIVDSHHFPYTSSLSGGTRDLILKMEQDLKKDILKSSKIHDVLSDVPTMLNFDLFLEQTARLVGEAQLWVRLYEYPNRRKMIDTMRFSSLLQQLNLPAERTAHWMYVAENHDDVDVHSSLEPASMDTSADISS